MQSFFRESLLVMVLVEAYEILGLTRMLRVAYRNLVALPQVIYHLVYDSGVARVTDGVKVHPRSTCSGLSLLLVFLRTEISLNLAYMCR